MTIVKLRNVLVLQTFIGDPIDLVELVRLAPRHVRKNTLELIHWSFPKATATNLGLQRYISRLRIQENPDSGRAYQSHFKVGATIQNGRILSYDL